MLGLNCEYRVRIVVILLWLLEPGRYMQDSPEGGILLVDERVRGICSLCGCKYPEEDSLILSHKQSLGIITGIVEEARSGSAVSALIGHT